MIRRLCSMAVAVALALSGAIMLASPANAHHEWNYPNYGWLRYGTDWVSVADRTQPFPVNTSVANWDQGVNTVNLTYRWWDCASAIGCIMIWEQNLNAPGYIVFGDATPTFDGNGRFRGANVRLNPAAAVTAQQRQKTSTHEIGHALGLYEHPGAQQGYTGSVMGQGYSPPMSMYPDWHDFEAVNNLHAP